MRGRAKKGPGGENAEKGGTISPLSAKTRKDKEGTEGPRPLESDYSLNNREREGTSMTFKIRSDKTKRNKTAAALS